MFDLDSPSSNPLRLMVALGALGFQFWYLFTVGFTDVMNLSAFREASLLRAGILLAVVQGGAHLAIAWTAPANMVSVLTRISVVPIAPLVAMFAGVSFAFPGFLIMLHELLDKGNPTVALGYGAAAAYLGVAWWAFWLAEERAEWR